MLENLNKHQLEAVVSDAKYIRVIAGAGSGKTRVLTTRVAYLIKELKVFPYRILAITFTNKAANEMKSRVLSMISDLGRDTNISTIHSLCVRILREDIEALGYPKSFTIIDTLDQRSILNEAYRQLDIDRQIFTPTSMLAFISNNKSVGVDVSEAFSLASNSDTETAKAKLYEYYENRLKELYALDFDDLLIYVHRLFSTYPEVLEKWQKRYSHILVDEFQDVDHIQYDIVKYLAGNNNNLYVVGDPDQTIYTWRGADVNIIMNFEKDFSDVKTITLNENYRSTSTILGGANSVIVNNLNRVEKDLFTQRVATNKIIHYRGAGEAYEANWIANKIVELNNGGTAYKDIAILYRSNYLSRSIEKGLLDYNIPYVIFGGVRFYDRAEVKDALSYLRMITSSDDLAFTRVINTPRRGFGNKALDTLSDKSRELNISMYEVLKDYDVLSGKAKNEGLKFVNLIEEAKKMDQKEISLILNRLLNDSGYLAMLEADNESGRIDNLKELINDIEVYSENNESATLEEYLQMISLYTDKTNYDQGSFVQLMTIHAAKGLEFDHVFVANMSDGIFPSERSMAEGLDGLEEERRLAYVAFTRARKYLYLTDSAGYNYVLNKIKTTSRFIEEIDEDFVRRIGASFENKNNETFPRPKHASVSRMETLDTTGLKLSSGMKIIHNMYGDGVVVNVENGIATIAFMHPHGIKKIVEGHASITMKGN